MRGLKHEYIYGQNPRPLSHLLQMRGLKLLYWEGYRTWRQVASFTDAWIETGLTRIELLGGSRIFYRCVDWNLIWQQGLQARKVASFTDAWIETNSNRNYGGSAKVASFTDAWIETPTKHGQSPAKPSRIFYRCVDWNLCSNGALLASTSHLLQMRGLKHCPQKEYNNPIMSHLLQMRGLKRNQPYKHYRPRQVASFTDAWIETYQSAGVFSQCQSHLLQMRGLKRPF